MTQVSDDIETSANKLKLCQLQLDDVDRLFRLFLVASFKNRSQNHTVELRSVAENIDGALESFIDHQEPPDILKQFSVNSWDLQRTFHV
jgi:hypothetical protein